MPVFGLKPKGYENFTEFKTRDIVLLASESTADRCQEAPRRHHGGRFGRAHHRVV